MYAHRQTQFTEAEYLALEAVSEIKHEYDAGVIVAMTGGSWEHSKISGNVFNIIHNALDGRRCDVNGSDLRVRTPHGKYYYPDISAVCGTPHLNTENPPCLLNPSVIIEVLSESTEAVDRGRKQRAYLAIPTLKEYVLIAQDEVLVEVLKPLAGGQAITEYYTALDATVMLESIGVTLPLRKLYARVFPYNERQDPPPDATS
jgi:Uma2 family endonuclease